VFKVSRVSWQQARRFEENTIKAESAVSGGGFQVVLSDLESMAGVFRRESAAFEAIMPPSGPACPDAGGGGIDAAMHAAVSLLGVLHQQMAGVIGEHASKLQAAHDNYEKTETSLAQLGAALTIPGTV
jgi:hypothetical protein